jgi:nucleoid DNA-binding protein
MWGLNNDCMDMEDLVVDSLVQVLSETISPDLLKEALTKPVKKALYKRLTEELFYALLKTKKINLSSGFGTVLIKDIGEKSKKVFDKKTGNMVTKKIKGSRIVYKPGDIVKPFL